MLACHFESSLDLMMFSDSPEEFDCSFGLDVEAELMLEEDDNPGTTRGTKLSIVQVIVFPYGVKRGVSPFFHSYETSVF